MSDLQRIMPNSDAPPCPGWLVGPPASHRDRHGPHYQGFLSDHLPMALLAMGALGTGKADLERYAEDYQRRLDQPVQHPKEPPADYRRAIGDPTAYGALLAWFDAEITTRGTQATLDSYLPGLISGWARFAFHPIIRLGVCAVERHASGVPKA